MRNINIASIFAAICCLQYLSAQDAYLPFSKKRFNPKTQTPINIDTSKVKNIITKPLTLTIGLSEKVILGNSGNSVEAILASPFTSTLAFSGVLYNYYIYNRQKFFFSNHTGGTAASTVDGKGGTQLETSIVYTNVKYGPLSNALKHRDGIFEIRSRIIVGGKCPTNRAFEKFAKELKQIVKPGSAVKMSIVPTFLFYNKFPSNVQYYAFPGSYINETSGKQFYSATTILKPLLPYRCITQKQFDETFGSMEDKDGRKLNTALPQKPVGDRPIVSTNGIKEIPVPFNVFPSIGGYV